MLRSLVGSEMCIRDSIGALQRDRRRPGGCVLDHVIEAHGDIVGECGVHACLLYTSDAADDLLCVDLGGRRIIKKKQKYIEL